MRVVSGIQPSGQLHLGNYFGAIKQHIELQKEHDTYYFIADYHAMTTVHDGAKLRQNCYEIAAAYLALGLDAEKNYIFRQSDVPEVTELAWILATVTGMGVLNRSHAYKEKLDAGLPASVGLFAYPLLMAADILIYDAELVPVGVDQVQHIEITKDVATSFNGVYKQPIFKLPKAKISEAGKVVGTDGRKMGKSYGNTIPIFFQSINEITKIVNSIKTDSTDYTKDPLKTENETIFSLFSLMATPAEIAEMTDNYQNNRSFGYGHAKQKLIEKIEHTFKIPSQEYFLSLEKHRQATDSEMHSQLDMVLAIGAEKARIQAIKTLKKVRDICGL